jgi:hypothetical protein
LDGDTPTALTPHVVKVRKYGYLFTEALLLMASTLRLLPDGRLRLLAVAWN